MAAPFTSGSARGLAPGELADAAVMAAVAAGLTVLGSIVPHAGSVQLAAVVPFGLVTYRHRPRGLVAAAVASALLAALVIGIGSAVGIAIYALIGGWVGVLKRRGRGVGTVVASAFVLAPALAGLALLIFWIFASYRQLVLVSFSSTFRGLGRLVSHLGPLHPVGDAIRQASHAVVVHWQISVIVIVLVTVTAALFASWVLIGEVLERLAWVQRRDIYTADVVAEASRAPGAAVAEPAPVPVRFRDVTVRYGATVALAGLDLDLPRGEFIAIVGDNGSGKSTLARLLAGAQPTSGRVERDGPVGLGRPGGTVLITQRPDAQIVGLRVIDDVLWGLPVDHEVDVEDLLKTVGLGGMGERDTATLSGGQLQRLAVASALAREPRLLISDEATAMIDPAGRRELVAVLAQLPRRWPMSVVHITHNVNELELADRVIRLARGRVQEAPPASPEITGAPEPPVLPVQVGEGDPDIVRLEDVGHSYAHDTVWEHRALEGIDLRVAAGEGLLIVGDNGSGKSTLAWIVAGLLRPTHGTCLIAGQPAHRCRGQAPIAFQHARLQLQRPRVGEDIADAAGWLHGIDGRLNRQQALAGALAPRVSAALEAVGLNGEIAGRFIEELSGGQQRRLAIAGLLAGAPRILVLDEPLAGLDVPTRIGLVELLSDLRARAGLTLMVVTHDPELLLPVCPRVLRLEGGTIVADGAYTPRTELAGRGA